jgi:cation transport ATPase
MVPDEILRLLLRCFLIAAAEGCQRISSQQAQVNLATEAATVPYDPAAVTADDLTAAIGTAGYSGLVRSGDEPPASTASSAPPHETADAFLVAAYVALAAGAAALVVLPAARTFLPKLRVSPQPVPAH